MKAIFILVIIAFLTAVKPAFAHRLDEYLQAAKIGVEKDQVNIEMRLMPGVQVFSKVFKSIDTDGDGSISETEKKAYAEKVRGDLTLTIDNKPAALSLASLEFPALDDMKEGDGAIVMHFTANLPPGGLNRTLRFEKHHQSDISVYLVNCLVPRDPDIHIAAQDRNFSQSSYKLDFTEAAGAPNHENADAHQFDNTGNHSLFKAYIFQGIHHILTGYDHLLFVSALVLAATTLWDLIKVVSTFTLAHTITLTLAALNLVHLPSRVVEPLISASIVFVAVQNVFWPGRTRGWSRLGAAFFFGLFHGLGFAGGLLDAMREMPSSTMLLAILAFSIGVEAGHQMVVLPLFAILKAARRTQPDAVTRTRLSIAFQRFGSAGISAAGVYYLGLALTGNS